MSIPVKTEPAVIAVTKIHPNPINPRKVSEAERSSLSESLQRTGQLFPIWVRPHSSLMGEYELVDGERRWWGAQMAGIEEMRVEIGRWSDEEVVLIAMTTGTESNPLSPMGRARGLAWLMSQAGATQESVAQKVGLSQDMVSKLLAVLNAVEEVQLAVESEKLPISTAIYIAAVDRERQAELCARVVTPEDGPGPLSQQATRLLIKNEYSKPRRVPVAGEGQVALSVDENERVFPGKAVEPAPESGYVHRNRPIPADLLKPEVAERAPVKFSEVAEAAPVYVGVDGHGHTVELVKVAEALASVSKDDRHIFREDVARDAGMPKPARGEVPSRRVEEAAAKREADKASRQRRKKEKAGREWLLALYRALKLDDMGGSYGFWSLVAYELLMGISDEDCAFVVEAVDDEAAKEDYSRAGLNDLISRSNVPALAALASCMLVTPRLRAAGVDSPTAVEWHRQFLASAVPRELAPGDLEHDDIDGLPGEGDEHVFESAGFEFSSETEEFREALRLVLRMIGKGRPINEIVAETGVEMKDVIRLRHHVQPTKEGGM